MKTAYATIQTVDRGRGWRNRERRSVPLARHDAWTGDRAAQSVIASGQSLGAGAVVVRRVIFLNGTEPV